MRVISARDAKFDARKRYQSAWRAKCTYHCLIHPSPASREYYKAHSWLARRNRSCRYDSRSRNLPDSPDLQTNHGNVDVTLPAAPDVVWPPSSLPKANLHGAAIRFMDRGLFLRSQVQTGTITFTEPDPIPSHVRPFLSNRDTMRQITTSYYRLANRWLPIISKRKIFDQLLNPLLPLRADAVFLLLCMKTTITQPLLEPCSWPSEYHAAVRYRTDLELAGLASLEILQGCILLAVYEQGNAIYPAAHTSIGICLQHASALGMGWTYSIASHIDAEERNRSWWAIFLLER